VALSNTLAPRKARRTNAKTFFSHASKRGSSGQVWMSKFVHLLRTPDARYAIGAAVSWPIYGALYIAMLKMFDKNYAAAASISWILSYGVVYAFQKYGTFRTMSREAMLREVGHYAVAVAGLSAAVNFALVKVLANYDSTLYKTAAVVAAAVAAALVAWFVSTRILRIGGPADSGFGCRGELRTPAAAPRARRAASPGSHQR
jgi:putative flippase GtrA